MEAVGYFEMGRLFFMSSEFMSSEFMTSKFMTSEMGTSVSVWSHPQRRNVTPVTMGTLESRDVQAS